MINLSFKRSSDAATTAALKLKGPKVVEALRVELNQVLVDLQRSIQRKLSGGVLQSRSGQLLRSVELHPVEQNGGVLKGTVTAGGGLTAAYASVQEEGGRQWYDIFPGIVTGKSDKKALAFFPGGSQGAGDLRAAGLKLYFKQGLRRGTLRPNKVDAFAGLGGIVVTHVHHPPLEARSYMKSSLDELRADIIARIHETAAKALVS